MATLIGRECWHCVGGFTYGKIVEHNLEHGSCVILSPDGNRKSVAAVNVSLTRDDALRQIAEAIAYWNRAWSKLIDERDEEDARSATERRS